MYFTNVQYCLRASLRTIIHYEISSRALRVSVFLIRTAKHSLSVEAIRYVQTSLVRTILEFGCVVWPPHQLGHIQRLRGIQDRFFSRVVGVNLGFVYQNVLLDHRVEILCLDRSTPSPREDSCATLYFSIGSSLVTGEADCNELLNLVDFRVPGRTLTVDLFWHNISLQPTTPKTPPSPDGTKFEVLSHRTQNPFADSKLRLKSSFSTFNTIVPIIIL